jgi:hypothetical protein
VDLKAFLKNFNLLNVCLIIASLIFAYGFLFPQRESNGTFTLPPLKKKPAEKTQTVLPKAQSTSPLDYGIIADQNLFHPERRIPPEKKAEAVLPKPEFILFGTLITPDLKVAYLEDKKAPVTTPGRGKRQTALKKGESMSGFILKEIMADKVVLARGEETLSVFLVDPKSPKTREVPAVSQARPQPPGIPGPALPAPTGGQPSRQPMPSGPGAFPAGGTPISPSPAPTGVMPSPGPSSPGGIIPSMPTSPAGPTRRSRSLPLTRP